MDLERRRLLFGGAAVAALAGCRAAGSARRAVPPGEKRNIALIGCGIQMRYLARRFTDKTAGSGMRVVAACDCDAVRARSVKEIVDKAYGDGACRTVRDFRDLLDDPSIDAVCVATPDHWHAYICVEAMKRGKDVYCEKPLTWSVQEAVELIKAEKKYGTVFQTGSMQRSMREFFVAASLVRGGAIGAVRHVDANFGAEGSLAGGPSHPVRFWYNPANAAAEGAENKDLDWEMWLGPAKRRPYSDRLAPRGVNRFYPMFWRCDDDLATGMCGDWGAHHFDIAQWALGFDESGPCRVVRSNEPHSENPLHGGRRQFGARLVFDTADGEVDVAHGPAGLHWGDVFYGTDGIVAVNRDIIAVWTGTGVVEPVAEIRRQIADGSYMPEKRIAYSNGKGTPALAGELDRLEKDFAAEIAKAGLYRSTDHIRNFCECVQTRERTSTPASVGARSSVLCQLANLSYKYDTGFDWNPRRFGFANGTGAGIDLKRTNSNGWEVEA